MKLFIYDEKHDRVNGVLDLGSLAKNEEEIVEKIIEWLDMEEITTRYHRLVLAESFKMVIDEVGEDPQVKFDYGENL